jgi:hypothetical protein
MKFTKQLAMLAGAVAVLGSLAFATPAVAAAPGYPGTTTTTVAPPVTTPSTITITLASGGTETISIGQTDTVTITGGTPGATYAISIDGTSTGLSITADANGNVTITIAVTDPHISVDSSTPDPAVVGTNTILLVPTSGATLTDYVIIPASTTAVAGSSGSGGTVATSSGSLAFTGADIAATVVGGIALLAVGTLLVVFTRRRAGQRA